MPRPHEMLKGWVPEVWRIGGLVRAELDKICNTERDKLLANVAGLRAQSALARSQART
jgi:hypothetical protein